MAKSELGSKHKCQNCGTKFFDLNKDPVVCPKCGEVQATVAAVPSPVRATTRSAPVRANTTDDEDTDNEEGPEVMSLEDADQAEDGQVAPTGTDDAEIEGDDDADDDNSDDDTFLEEEDDDSNVSDLIDGDVESDEER